MVKSVHRGAPRRSSALVLSLLLGLLVAATSIVDPAPRTAGAVEPVQTFGEVRTVSAVLHEPYALTAGPDGAVWFRHGAGTIGRVQPDGAYTAIEARGAAGRGGIAAGPDGNVWYTSGPDHLVGRVNAAGSRAVFTDPALDTPDGIAAGPDGNLWVTDPGADAIERITPAGVVTRYRDPALRDPGAITSDGVGALWFVSVSADGYSTTTISRITTAGVLTSFPMSGWRPSQLVVAPDGNVWYADFTELVRLTPDGVVTRVPVALPTGHGSNVPGGIAVGPDGALWVTFQWSSGNTPQPDHGWVGRFDLTGTRLESFDDGMDDPHVIVAGPDGNLWFTNTPGSLISEPGAAGYLLSLTPAGVATRQPALALYRPLRLAPDPNGGVYVVDGRPWGARPALIHVGPNGLETIEPSGVADVVAADDGTVWFAAKEPGTAPATVGRIAPDGTVTRVHYEAFDNDVGPIAVARGGGLWVARSLPMAAWGSIERVSPSGAVEESIGTYTVGAVAALLAVPDGSLHVLGRDGRYARWTPEDGMPVVAEHVTSIAWSPYGVLDVTTDDGRYGSPTDATYRDRLDGIDRAEGLVAGQDGNEWVTDPGARKIARVGIGHVTTVFDAWATVLARGVDQQLWFASHDRVGSIGAGIGLVDVSYAHATPLGGAALVDWWVSYDYGSWALTAGYTVTASPGGQTCAASGPASRCLVKGLTNGTAYTFTVAATNAAGTGAPSPPSEPVVPEFADVRTSAPFHDDIAWVAAEQIATGFADNTFRPGAPVTRQAMAAFLYRQAGSPSGATPTCTAPPYTGTPFTDVPKEAPFCGEIAWLTASGLASGYPDGTFRPTAPVTRRAVAAFLYRAAGSPAGTHPVCAEAPFTDVAKDAPFCGEIAWLAAAGISTGDVGGTFRPDAPVSRGAMAAFLHRLDALGPP